jgi:HD superfamily phosphohydrolase
MPAHNKLLRDPIHGVISFDATDPTDRLLLRLVDAPEFQRLRHIRQLGLAFFVYPAAEHSRFAHSLGVAHIARQICDRIRRHQEPLPTHTRMALCAAALLHDVGHAPLSHAFEPVIAHLWQQPMRHERFSEGLILHPESTLHQRLAEADPDLPDLVADLIMHRAHHFAAPIISSQLDADRMDYLLRDGYMTGVQNYHYDAQRIQEMLGHDANGLLVDRRALPAVESYLLSRLHMYQQVYFHKTLRAAEGVLRAIFRRVVALLEAGDASGLAPPGPLQTLLMAAHLALPPPLAAYARLTDHHVWVALEHWAHHPDPILSDLCARLLQRRLLKSVEVPEEELQTFEQIHRPVLEEIVRASGRDPAYYTLLDRAENLPFLPYDMSRRGDLLDAIRMDMGGGRVEPIERVSPLVRSLAQMRYRVFRFYFPEEAREGVLRALGAR